MHEVLINRLGGLSLPRKSVVRLTDRPDMTLDVYRGRKTTMQQQQQLLLVASGTVGSLKDSYGHWLSLAFLSVDGEMKVGRPLQKEITSQTD